jgi:hypothetical protein
MQYYSYEGLFKSFRNLRLLIVSLYDMSKLLSEVQ